MLGFPRSSASCLVVVAAIGVVAATLARLSVPAAEWFSRVPLAMARLRYTFREVVTAVQDMREFPQTMANLSANNPQDSALVVHGSDLTQVFPTNTVHLLTLTAVTAPLLSFP